MKLALDTKSNSGNKATKKGKRTIRTASTAMILGLILGLVQAIFLIFSSKLLLGFMGVKPVSFQKYIDMHIFFYRTKCFGLI